MASCHSEEPSSQGSVVTDFGDGVWAEFKRLPTPLRDRAGTCPAGLLGVTRDWLRQARGLISRPGLLGVMDTDLLRDTNDISSLDSPQDTDNWPAADAPRKRFNLPFGELICFDSLDVLRSLSFEQLLSLSFEELRTISLAVFRDNSLQARRVMFNLSLDELLCFDSLEVLRSFSSEPLLSLSFEELRTIDKS
jgi:hypothetical protein